MKRLGTVDVKEWSQDLRSERLRRGLSLRDVAGKAGISISLLKALEQGRFEDIGSPVLVCSHLSAYAQALGNGCPPATDEQASCPAPTFATSSEPADPESLHSPAGRKGVPALVGFFVIGLMALGICYQLGWFSQPDHPQGKAESTQQEVSPESSVQSETPLGASPHADVASNVEEPSVPSDPQDAAGGVQAVQLTEEGATKEPPISSSTEEAAVESVPSQPVSLHHRFEIEALQASWVEIKIDGRKTEGFLLRPGEKKDWHTVQELQILVGNAGGIQMKWDGAPVNLGGRPGQVLRLRLPHPNLTGKSP